MGASAGLDFGTAGFGAVGVFFAIAGVLDVVPPPPAGKGRVGFSVVTTFEVPA